MWNEGEDETSQGGGGGDVVLPTGAWSCPLGCGPAH